MPAWEAEYSFEDFTPLRLYDCLTPTVKEQRRLKINKLTDDWILQDNNKALLQLRRAEIEKKRADYPEVLKDNRYMKAKIQHMEKDMEVIDMYLQLMESGYDTKKIVVEYEE